MASAAPSVAGAGFGADVSPANATLLPNAIAAPITAVIRRQNGEGNVSLRKLHAFDATNDTKSTKSARDKRISVPFRYGR
ncbi:MAG: hypothetical protein LCH88_05710 [Proteobacteria bacterium]|nr:hypothetical protein [Pseudomonadota bacterium]